MIKSARTRSLSKRRPFTLAIRRALLESLEHRTLFSTFTVANTLDDGSAGSLRWAVNQANLNPGDDTINFDPAVFAVPQTISLEGKQLQLTDTSGATTITGPTGGVTIAGGLIANGGNASREFEIFNLVTASISGMTLTGGRAVYGGGILNYGTATLTNCTVSGNKSLVGGGIMTGSYDQPVGSTTMVNCTVSGNSGFGNLFGYGTTTTLTNTIADDIEGTAVGSNNLVSGDSGGLVNGVDGNIVGVTNLQLAPLGNYGGTGETMALLPGSPALDAGTNGAGIPTTDGRGLNRFGPVDIGAFESQGFNFAIVPGSTPQSANIGTAFSKPLAVTVTANNPVEPVDGAVVNFVTDPASNGATAFFEGPSSSVVTGGTFSVTAAPNDTLGHYTVTVVIPGFSGSFALTNTGTALPSPLTVNTTSDAYAPGAGLLSLREAIAFADLSSLPSSNITFDTKTFKTAQTIKLTNGQLELSNTVGTTTITAPSKGVTIDGGGLSRVYVVAAAVTASLSGFTITGGESGFQSGAGVANYGSVALTNCTISGNTSSSSGGGGVANFGAATLSNCTIRGNAANGSGGGLFSYGTVALTQCTVTGNSTTADGGGVSANGPLTMTNCTVSHNTAYGGYSGGGGVSVGDTATLTNCTISSNSITGSSSKGGGVANTSGTLTLVNTSICGNSAPLGGGIITESGKTTMTRCTVSGNTANSGGGVVSYGVLFFTIYPDGTYSAAPVDGRTTLTNCVVSCNSAKGTGTDGSGGGLLNNANGDTTLTNCSVTGNSATNSGGGLFSQGSAPGTNYGGYTNYAAATLANCTVTGNTAASNGGGLGNGVFSNSTITNSNIIANSAGVGGGGISITGGAVTISQSLVTLNSVRAGSGGTATGGGIDCEGGTLTIANCTIALNRAIGGNGANGANGGNAYGGGIYVAAGATAKITNSFISLNLASGGRGGHGGSNGRGIGGGVFYLGAFTSDLHTLILFNLASTNSNNIGT